MGNYARRHIAWASVKLTVVAVALTLEILHQTGLSDAIVVLRFWKFVVFYKIVKELEKIVKERIHWDKQQRQRLLLVEFHNSHLVEQTLLRAPVDSGGASTYACACAHVLKVRRG